MEKSCQYASLADPIRTRLDPAEREYFDAALRIWKEDQSAAHFREFLENINQVVKKVLDNEVPDDLFRRHQKYWDPEETGVISQVAKLRYIMYKNYPMKFFSQFGLYYDTFARNLHPLKREIDRWNHIYNWYHKRRFIWGREEKVTLVLEILNRYLDQIILVPPIAEHYLDFCIRGIINVTLELNLDEIDFFPGNNYRIRHIKVEQREITYIDDKEVGIKATGPLSVTVDKGPMLNKTDARYPGYTEYYQHFEVLFHFTYNVRDGFPPCRIENYKVISESES